MAKSLDKHTHQDEGAWYWIDHGAGGTWHNGMHHYHDVDPDEPGWLGAARYSNVMRPILAKQAEVMWWCDDKGEGIRLRIAYGGISWENYCVPHIDLDLLPAGTKPRESYEADHLGCGPSVVWRRASVQS